MDKDTRDVPVSFLDSFPAFSSRVTAPICSRPGPADGWGHTCLSDPPFPSCQPRSQPGNLIPGLDPAGTAGARSFPHPQNSEASQVGCKILPIPKPGWCILDQRGEGCDKLHPCIPHCHCQRQGAPPDPKASPQAPTSHGVSLPGSLSAGKPWVGAAGSAIHPSQSPLEMQSPPRLPHHQTKPLRWRIRQDIKSLAFISGHNMFF